ncbi:hypothetical protein [Streptomyces mutabilis]|uniref:hypothetical protein n=1 Tax=Streptomyces mutabilis TaxID=67332 RepID=UPI003678C541
MEDGADNGRRKDRAAAAAVDGLPDCPVLVGECNGECLVQAPQMLSHEQQPRQRARPQPRPCLLLHQVAQSGRRDRITLLGQKRQVTPKLGHPLVNVAVETIKNPGGPHLLPAV